MPRFAGTLVLCGLTLFAGVGCSARQIVPEPAVQAVEPAQVTLDALQQAQHAPDGGSEISSIGQAGKVDEASTSEIELAVAESNPFFVVDDEADSRTAEEATAEQALATDEPNPFMIIEQTSATVPLAEDSFVEHATHVVKEGCAGPECELIGLEPLPAPGADQTNPRE